MVKSRQDENEEESEMTGSQVYVIYIAVVIGLTAALARTLFHNGTPFLRDVFPEKPEVAQAVNRLLVTGFYMLNLGYALFILRASVELSGFEAFQFLVNRLALLLLTLAGIHFVNVFVFWKIRTHHERQRHLLPTVTEGWGPGQAGMAGPGSPPVAPEAT
jgi:hypothetical protein